jgi:hypothetical protein
VGTDTTLLDGKMANRGKSTRKSNRGGRREGAGRKTDAVRTLRAELEAEANRLICEQLPRLVANMLHIANGGYERVEEKWEPVEGGDPDSRGELVMQLVERKVSIADKDRAANIYLLDRVLGKPKQAIELATKELLESAQLFVIPEVDDRPEPDEAG